MPVLDTVRPSGHDVQAVARASLQVLQPESHPLFTEFRTIPLAVHDPGAKYTTNSPGTTGTVSSLLSVVISIELFKFVTNPDRNMLAVDD
jgi:hypothetical protein